MACAPARRSRPRTSQRDGRVVAYAGPPVCVERGGRAARGARGAYPKRTGLIVGGHSSASRIWRERRRSPNGWVLARGSRSRVSSSRRRVRRRCSSRRMCWCCPIPQSAISTRYTSPLKLFEYMAAGRPIVASSDLPSIREVLTDGRKRAARRPGRRRGAGSRDPAAVMNDPAWQHGSLAPRWTR